MSKIKDLEFIKKGARVTNRYGSNEQEESTKEFAKRFLAPGSLAIKESIQSNADKIANDIVSGVKKGFED